MTWNSFTIIHGAHDCGGRSLDADFIPTFPIVQQMGNKQLVEVCMGEGDLFNFEVEIKELPLKMPQEHNSWLMLV